MAIVRAENDYSIPRASLAFDPFDANGNLTGELPFGNCPGYTLSIETEKSEHFSSEIGLQEKDAAHILKVTRKGKLITDNCNIYNLARYLTAEVEVVSQSSGTVADEARTVIPGRVYQIGQTADNPAGVKNISSVTVTDDEVTPATLVLGTDYNIDLETGRIQIIEGTSLVAAGGGVIHIAYTKAAATWKRIKTGGATSLEGALRSVSAQTVGSKRDYYMPKVTLTPTGELPVITDGTDYVKMEFDVEVLTPTVGSAIYVDGRPESV